ncbi:MAG: acyl-CoA dehydrogenase family protein, partial [Ilumatobacteraceae bacterium]
MSGDEMIQRVAGIGALIEADAERISDDRRLTPEVLDALRGIGVFRIASPRDRGGLELTPLEAIKVLEAITYHDGSTGWVAMICCDGEMYAGMCADEGVIDELFGEPDLLTSG